MKRILRWLLDFSNKYIVSEDPNDTEFEKVFQNEIKKVEENFKEWQQQTPPKRKRGKRGRPKKKK